MFAFLQHLFSRKMAQHTRLERQVQDLMARLGEQHQNMKRWEAQVSEGRLTPKQWLANMQPYAVPSYAADKAVSSSPQLRPEPQSLAVPSPKSPKGKGYCGRWSPVRDHAESSAPLHSSNSLSASMKRQPPPLSPGAVGPGSWLEGLVGFADTNTEDWSMDQVEVLP